MAHQLLDTPAPQEVVTRDLLFDRDSDGTLAWTVRATTQSGLPVLALADSGEAPLGPSGPKVVCRHTTPKGLAHRWATRVVVGRADESSVRRHPDEVLAEWRRGSLLLDPASRHAISPDLVGGVEWVHGVRVLPLRTATLPPATHTNCLFVGERRALLVDPGSAEADEQLRLCEAIDRFVGRNGPLGAIFLTHHHADHVSGVPGLLRRFRLPVWAHPETASRVAFPVDRLIAPSATFEPLEGGPAGWEVAHTPGHAPGHLSLRRASDGAAVVGDMVASIGTILIDPSEGDVREYVTSLRSMAAQGIGVVHPAHGDPVFEGTERVLATAGHREWRETLVLAALRAGARSLAEVTAQAYAPNAVALGWLAARSTEAHLVALERAGVARRDEVGAWHPAAPGDPS